jgi:hypothetical protein
MPRAGHPRRRRHSHTHRHGRASTRPSTPADAATCANPLAAPLSESPAADASQQTVAWGRVGLSRRAPRRPSRTCYHSHTHRHGRASIRRPSTQAGAATRATPNSRSQPHLSESPAADVSKQAVARGRVGISRRAPPRPSHTRHHSRAHGSWPEPDPLASSVARSGGQTVAWGCVGISRSEPSVPPRMPPAPRRRRQHSERRLQQIIAEVIQQHHLADDLRGYSVGWQGQVESLRPKLFDLERHI